MMVFERMEVWTRDEYRGAQEPVAFEWRGQHYEVEEVLDRWYEGGLDARRMPLRYFKVRVSSGEVFIVRFHEMFQAWSLLVPREMMEEDLFHVEHKPFS